MVYKLEIFQNLFLFVGKFARMTPQKFEKSNKTYVFELSKKKQENTQLLDFLNLLKGQAIPMIGFNNISFDFQLLARFLLNPYKFTYKDAYNLSQRVYSKSNIKPLKNTPIKQIDLFKMNNFNFYSNKVFLDDVQLMIRWPHGPMAYLDEGISDAYRYAENNLGSLVRFTQVCKEMVLSRLQIESEKIVSGDIVNMSDITLGTRYIVDLLGYDNCFHKKPWGPRQTIRESVDGSSVIADRFKKLDNKRMQALVERFSQEINPEEGFSFVAEDYSFGLGGLHYSKKKSVYRKSETQGILDIDVKSMYPTLSKVHQLKPEHMPAIFPNVYYRLVEQRKQYDSSHILSFVLKKAANAVYGKSNDKFSPFLDAKFLYSITINGQLSLYYLITMLEEEFPGQVEVIQANTDGLTILYDGEIFKKLVFMADAWKTFSGLDCTMDFFRKIHIKDVNNYLAIDMANNVKSVGAYWFPTTASQFCEGSNSSKNYSNIASKKAAHDYIVNGRSDSLTMNSNAYDFMIHTKSSSKGRYYLCSGDDEKPLNDVFRYLVVHKKYGDELKVKYFSPQKNKGRYKEVYAESSKKIEAGYHVKICNQSVESIGADLSKIIDYEYYYEKRNKLLFMDEE